MPEPTISELQAQIDDLKTRVAKEEAELGFWAGLDAKIASNPKVMVFATLVMTFITTWASTYFSKPATRDVVGPERVIEKHIEGPTTIKEVPAKPKDDPLPPPVPPGKAEFLDVSFVDAGGEKTLTPEQKARALKLIEIMFRSGYSEVEREAARLEFNILTGIKAEPEPPTLKPLPPSTDPISEILSRLAVIEAALKIVPPTPPPVPVDPSIAELRAEIVQLKARVTALEAAKPPPAPKKVAAYITFVGADKGQSLATNNDVSLRKWFAGNNIKVFTLDANDPGIERSGLTKAVEDAGGVPAAVVQDSLGKVIAQFRITTAAQMRVSVTPYLGAK